MSNQGKIPIKKLVRKKDGTQYVGTFYISPKEYSELSKKTQKTSVDEYTNSKGEWLPERVRQHKEIINKYVTDCPKPKEGEKPTAILLLGGAASGKSTVVNKYLKPKYGDRFGTVNADDIKADLGDKKTFDKYSMQDVMTSANRVHQESSMLGKKITSQVIEEKRNLIYDGVLGNETKAKKLIQSLKDKGYDVKLVGVTVDTEEALSRAKTRALGNLEEGGSKRGSGRYVPDKILVEGHIGSANTFESVKDLVDSFELYDNNVKMGEDPVKVIEGGEIFDPAKYEKFKNKSNASLARYLAPTIQKSSIELELSEEEIAYNNIEKAFNQGLVDSDTFLKAEERINQIRYSIQKANNSEYSDFIVLNESVDKILLLNRSKIDEMGSGEWCLPGGTVEQGENIEAAAYRELEEETGLEISPLNSHYVDTYTNEDGSKTHYFQTIISENAMIYLDNSEHYNYTWASIDKLDMYYMIFNLEERISNILMPKPKKIKKSNSLIDRFFSFVVDVSEKLTGNKIDKSEIINKDEIIERQFNEGVISAENFFKYLNDQSYKEIEDMSGDKQLKHKLKLENTLGRTRSSMPQIDSDNIDDVVIHFSQNSPDAKVEKININVNDLRFSQNEIDDEKVNNLMKRSNPLSINNRFLVAGNKKEGFYVIDGHHRLAAIANLAEDSLNIPCYLIKLTPKEAIRRLNLMKITSKESVEKSEEKITIIGGEEVSKSYIKELYEKYF